MKRFATSLDRRDLSQFAIDSARAVLAPREFELWSQMSLSDKKHSITVHRRFSDLMPNAEIAAVRASLLHDVGKTKSNLGVLSRVVATILGSKGKRFSQYHDHEAIGAQMLREIGSHLVEIHGQHDDRGLIAPAGHRALLDAFARTDVSAVAAAFASWRSAEARLAA
ncbi:MAG: hypothetical protein ACKO2A_09240, partial [Acidimicrobiaceae bacterium]